jgi:hypothetical protein
VCRPDGRRYNALQSRADLKVGVTIMGALPVASDYHPLDSIPLNTTPAAVA